MKLSNLYVAHAKMIKDVHVVLLVENVELWYKRLWHMSEKDMVELSKRNKLFNIKNQHLKKCDQ